MRFCETNPNHGDAFFDVTVSACDSCNGAGQNPIRVRLAKPNRFWRENDVVGISCARNLHWRVCHGNTACGVLSDSARHRSTTCGVSSDSAPSDLGQENEAKLPRKRHRGLSEGPFFGLHSGRICCSVIGVRGFQQTPPCRGGGSRGGCDPIRYLFWWLAEWVHI